MSMKEEIDDLLTKNRDLFDLVKVPAIWGTMTEYEKGKLLIQATDFFNVLLNIRARHPGQIP